MKFTSVLIFVTALIVAFTCVSAAPHRETNSERFARGLPPLAPQKRSGTPTYGAKRWSPSGSPSTCSTGPAQCCKTVGTNSNPGLAAILRGLGMVVGPDVLVGSGCTAVAGNTCSHQAVCCTNNSSSLISVGCLPITL